MKITDEELQVLEELHHYGTPLDAAVLEEARAARRGLEITQTGNCAENALYAQTSGVMGIMASLEIKNVSKHVIPIRAVRLEMPGLDTDFHWLRRLSSKEVREHNGYVLPAAGPFGFDPAVVLNHLFVRDLRVYPKARIEGLLLGEGAASVPDEFQERNLIPVVLVVYAGRSGPYRAWMKLTLRREGQLRRDSKKEASALVAESSKRRS
jgi:hypothetical protein